MQFIETLKLKSKLFFLFILITIGLISIGLFGMMHLESMKKNADGLYFGSLVPITELDEIMQNYNSNLTSAIYKAHRLEASPDETIFIIHNSIEKIQNRWKNYQAHFKHEEELEYVEYVSLEIEAINKYFLQISSAAKQGKNLNELNVNILEKKVSFISSVLHKLINYEVRVAEIERSRFLQNYQLSLKQLGLFLGLIILAVLAISYYVFRTIQEENEKLEVVTSQLKDVNQKLENVSFNDLLTGLYNKRYFNFVYENELRHAKRSNSYITLMMLELDYFKKFTDRYGLLEGDKALQSVANILKEILDTPGNYLFRFSGERFGIFLDERDETSSAKLAGEICDALRIKEIKHELSEASEYLSLSIGVVCCVADEVLDEAVLLLRSEEMLYEAKERGGDRYVITSNVSEAKAQVVEEEIII